MSTKKYRPYFTLAELLVLRDSVTSHPSLYQYLFKYIRDIEDGLRKENHTLQPTISQKLELEEPIMEHTNPYTKTPEELYTEWMSRGCSFAGLSPARIETIQQYRYTNDLMTPEEESAYEKTIGASF